MNFPPFPVNAAWSIVAAIQLLASIAAGEDGWHWSASGHTRTMYESYRGVDFGFSPIEDDDWIHQRVQLMGVLQHGNEWELATELTWGRMWGKEAPLAPPDEDEVDLLQLYLQRRISLGTDSLEIRAGRQTLYYGSGRLLASREGANQRLAHDALRISWVRAEDHRIDAFIASPVEINPNSFDNESDFSRVRFWSVYSVTPLGADHFIDAYYIGLRDEDSIFVSPEERELRHTIGIRNWNRNSPFEYNTEFILQFGKAGKRDILAGAASVEVGYEFTRLPWKPMPRLRADVISGGDEADSLHTFHPLFQANNYFNEGGFLSPSNLYNINPLLGLRPRENVVISLGVNFQWLFSTRDAIYGPPLQRLAQPAAGGDRYLGTAFNASVVWEFAKGATAFLGFTHHEAGGALTSIGGRSVDYVQMSLRWGF